MRGRGEGTGGARPLRALALAALLGLSACAGGPGSGGGFGGADRGRVQFAVLDAVNALRTARGEAALGLDPSLTAAAATHSRDMAAQNRPWHFGSDGSSPPERAARAGYSGAFLGEAISESFETELETLAAWMEAPASREVVLDPLAREMGLAWHREPSGKLWWTLVTGNPDLLPTVPVATADRLPQPVFVSPVGAQTTDAPVLVPAPAGFPIETPIAPASGRPPPPGLRG